MRLGLNLPMKSIYNKGSHSRFITDLNRWSNNMFLSKSIDFEDYVPRKDGLSVKKFYPGIVKN